jgi:hypothetical protein
MARRDGDPGFGLYVGMDGHISWGAIPLRLTAQGHEFLAALSNAEIWQKTKAEAQRFGGGLTPDLLKALAKGFLKGSSRIT